MKDKAEAWHKVKEKEEKTENLPNSEKLPRPKKQKGRVHLSSTFPDIKSLIPYFYSSLFGTIIELNNIHYLIRHIENLLFSASHKE